MSCGVSIGTARSSNDTPSTARCVYTHDEDAEFDMRSTGIFKRHEVDAAGDTRGTWTYTSELFPPEAMLVRSGHSK